MRYILLSQLQANKYYVLPINRGQAGKGRQGVDLERKKKEEEEDQKKKMFKSNQNTFHDLFVN